MAENELTRESISQEEKKKVQGWINPQLHKKVKIYTSVLEVDVQDFIAMALEDYCRQLDKKYGNQHFKNMIEG